MQAEDHDSNVVSAPQYRRERIYDRRKVTNLLEHFCAEMCCSAGCEYQGVQHGFHILPNLILFADNFGSTLALPIPDLTIEKIMAKVAASDQRQAQESVEDSL